MNEASQKVSIVLPTYNGSKYIGQSIESCLNQTYRNIELIIVDDGSTENIFRIVKYYRDIRIKYIKHEENKGLSNALNTGFAVATGEYLTWTSDDNYYANDAIESMVLLLNNKIKIDFVYANYYIIDEGGAILQSVKVGPIKKIKEGNCIGPCFLYRRRVYEEIGGYNQNAFLVEDYEYWVRVYKRFNMERLDKYIYWYRIHPNSLTGRYSHDAKMYEYQIKKQYFKIYTEIQPLINTILIIKDIIRRQLRYYLIKTLINIGLHNKYKILKYYLWKKYRIYKNG